MAWQATAINPPAPALEMILIAEQYRPGQVAMAQWSTRTAAWMIQGATGPFIAHFTWWMPIPPLPREAYHGAA